MCKISHELVGQLEPNLHGYLLKTWLGCGDIALIFKVTFENVDWGDIILFPLKTILVPIISMYLQAEWKTVDPCKPADQDLCCFQNRIYLGLTR